MTKAELRRDSIARRRALAATGAAAASAVADSVAQHLGGSDKIISGYVTLGDELDCHPAMERLAQAGIRLVLPVAGARGDRLVFRCWKPGEALIGGPFGTSHPQVSAENLEPDVLLVPLLAFDRRGHRLGYGAGYYDRTLAALRAEKPVTAIGLAFAGQEIAAVPNDPNDQPLDAVITEQGVMIFTTPFPFTR